MLSLPHSLRLKKKKGRKEEKEREREREKEIGGYQDLGGVASPSSSSHGRAGLDSFHHYVGPYAKTHEAWVYDGDGAHSLSFARGPCVPRARGRICGVLCVILQVRIRYAITPVPPLAITVL
jgi:hypothetical protein